MNIKPNTQTFVALLRGINVGGHHKVPMAELRNEFEKLGCENVLTILNTGNIIFDAKDQQLTILEKKISNHLEQTFGFTIPTILINGNFISEIIKMDPFKNIEVSKEIRLYVSFLQKTPTIDIELPWISEDKSYKILSNVDKCIISVLDLSISKTPKAMEALEKQFGKGITTRNWNTVIRISKKLNE